MIRIGVRSSQRCAFGVRLAFLACGLGLVCLTGPAVLPASAAGSPASLRADPGVAAALEVYAAWVERTLREREQPGLSIGIMYDQDLIWARGFGYADVARRVPATPRTAYRIGSISKLFTATAVMQLRDSGRLRLDDPVADHVSWFRPKNADPESSPITIRQLLTHTSGMPRELDIVYWTTMKFPAAGELESLVRSSPTVLPPGSKYKYSNLAVAIAGHVVSAVSGMPYETYVSDRILKPLGMTSTVVTPRRDMRGLANGYGVRVLGKPRSLDRFTDMGGMVAAGNLASTVEDLAKFVAFQFRDGPAAGAEVLRASSVREMQLVQWIFPDWKRGQGLGWRLRRVDEGVRLSHNGFVPGHVTSVSAMPDDKIGVIVLTNASDGSPSLYAEQAWAIVAPALRNAIPTKAKEPAKPDPEWARYVGDYVWADGSVLNVMLLDGELALVDLSEDNPWDARTRLEPVASGTFRMVDGDQEGETVRFEADRSGRVTRIVLPGYYAVRR